jgi:hypothetical protein
MSWSRKFLGYDSNLCELVNISLGILKMRLKAFAFKKNKKVTTFHVRKPIMICNAQFPGFKPNIKKFIVIINQHSNVTLTTEFIADKWIN